jgi:hypothetical protein
VFIVLCNSKKQEGSARAGPTEIMMLKALVGRVLGGGGVPSGVAAAGLRMAAVANVTTVQANTTEHSATTVAEATTTAALSTALLTTGAAVDNTNSMLTVLTQVSAALSVIGAVCIIVTFCAFKALRRRRGRQLIFFLSICDLLTALTYSFQPYDRHPELFSETLCKVQGLATIFFPVASFLWTLCISIFIFLSTPQQMKSFCVTHAVFHAVCWVVPAVLCIVVLANDMAGSNSPPAAGPGSDIHNTGGWCWLKFNTTDDPEKRLMWELIGGKGVEISCIIIVCVLYFFTARKFRANDMHELQQTLRPDVPVRQNVQEFQRKLVLVPLFFVLARLWGSINTFLFAFYGQQHIDEAYYSRDDGDAAGGGVYHRNQHHSAFWSGGDDDGLFVGLFGLGGGSSSSSSFRAESAMDVFIVVMECMQAFCDPIQGFLNGILFVAFSVEVRLLIAEHWGPRACNSCCCGRGGGRGRDRGHTDSAGPSFSSPHSDALLSENFDYSPRLSDASLDSLGGPHDSGRGTGGAGAGAGGGGGSLSRLRYDSDY